MGWQAESIGGEIWREKIEEREMERGYQGSVTSYTASHRVRSKERYKEIKVKAQRQRINRII